MKWMILVGAAFSGWLLNYLLMPHLIGWLHKWHFGQSIRLDGPQSHLKKQGTPVMGGLGFIATTLVSCLIFNPAGYTHPLFLLVVTAFVGYGAIGFWDDFLVVKKHNNAGLSPKAKFGLQCILALILAAWYMSMENTVIHLPFHKLADAWTAPAWLFACIAVVMLVAETNAVNLSDGMDGLSASLVAIALVPMLVFAIKQQERDVAILIAAMIGSLIAYLHYNKYPAQVMMGDTGSLAMGGLFSASALVLKEELAIIIIGGVFLLEVLSDIIQVGYFKATHGKRFFRMAPLHHHFELGGMEETDVVKMFRWWGVICAAAGIVMGVLL